jgi:hypothetical protein
VGFIGATLLPSAGRAHEEGGDPQTAAQQKCTNTVLSNWSKVSRASNKMVQACLKNYGGEKPLSDNPFVDLLEECLPYDGNGKLGKTKLETFRTFFDECEGIDSEGFPALPVYGVTTHPTVNAAAEQLDRNVVHDLFGSDLDAANLPTAGGTGDAKDASKCQQKIVKGATKCLLEREKQFLKCTKTHLASGGIYGLIYDVGDLALCYDGMDPAKIAGKCAGVAGQGIHKDVASCEAKVDDRTLSELVPGCASDDPAVVASCIDQAVRCRFCLSANAATGAERDCDLFDDADDANGSCLPCAASVAYDSTYEAIQRVVFESTTYGCTNMLCHGSFAPQGGLDLTDDPMTTEIDSYANLFNVPGMGASPPLDRVEPGEPALSFLYNKLAASTIPGHDAGGGSPMPSGGAPALTAEHLEAVERWIRGGAPEDLTVDGTALLLGSCLPDPDPLTIPIPDPPAAGVGIQLRQTPWPLPSSSEDEICMSTWYDVSALVPASAKVPCPAEFINANNPSGECFAYNAQTLLQDPQSHHSIIHIYTGTYGPTHPAWGAYTYKFQDPSNPLEGTACNPLAVGPNGQNENCSGSVQSAVACTNYGPPDYTFGGGTAPTFSGSQEPYYQQAYPGGVYNVLPLSGVVVWNSHAFNLTTGDSTMSQYLNLEFALGAPEQVYPVQGIFDSASIFVQEVPPFESREYCRTYTIPAGSSLFELSSHTHRHGTLWRTWAPPNTPCVPGDAACVPRGDTPIYVSVDYTDPLQLTFDPPVHHPVGSSVADRTYLYCSVFDNGSTPSSPAVKRYSTSPEPPLGFPFGGPCPVVETRCIGFNEGALCSGFESTCESFPGADDGDCDACTLRGGVTTEDEMFILIGNYFIP